MAPSPEAEPLDIWDEVLELSVGGTLTTFSAAAWEARILSAAAVREVGTHKSNDGGNDNVTGSTKIKLQRFHISRLGRIARQRRHTAWELAL